jgi:hypothetical protein
MATPSGVFYLKSTNPPSQILTHWTQHNPIPITRMESYVSTCKKQDTKQLLGGEVCVLGGEDVGHKVWGLFF